MTISGPGRSTMADDLVLVQPRRGSLKPLALMLAFTSGGVWMILSGSVQGWFVAVVFGGCALLMAVQLVRPSELRVDGEEIVERSPFRRRTWRLVDCSDFGVWRHRTAEMVCFDSPADAASRFGRMNARLSGRASYLSATYGWSAERLAGELARRADDARRRADGVPTRPPHLLPD